MSAGQSARREYERRSQRDRERRERILPIVVAAAIVGGAVSYVIWERLLPGVGWIMAFAVAMAAFRVLLPRQSTEAWRIGAEGEVVVARALEKTDKVRFLNDRRLPGSKANIDHLVVGAAGVLVVDAKKHKGRLEVRHGKLFIGGRDKSKLVDGVLRQAAAVRTALSAAGIAACDVKPVLCFVGTELPWGRTVVDGVEITGRRGLRKLAARDGAMTASSVEHVARVLAGAFPPA